MTEFYNVLFTAIASFIAGMAIHSAYVHSRKKREIRKLTPLEGD